MSKTGDRSPRKQDVNPLLSNMINFGLVPYIEKGPIFSLRNQI